MRTRCTLVAAVLVAGLSACSSDSTGPGSSFPSIAGSYAGNLTGLSQGIALNATFSVAMTQTGGDLNGIWGLQGVLNNGINTIPVAGNGPLTGTVAAGGVVSLIIRSTVCQAYQAAFSGSYDGSTGRLTLSGPVEFFGTGNCTVTLSYPSTIVLTR